MSGSAVSEPAAPGGDSTGPQGSGRASHLSIVGREHEQQIGQMADGSFSVNLDFFTGPLDLLLHLVHQQEVDIEKVELKSVCEQYLQIVLNSRFLDLERASEYLVIAATLIALKSDTLLPRSRGVDMEGLGDISDPDFYAMLRERLKNYELTKMRAAELSSMPQFGLTTFARLAREKITVEREIELEDADAQTLSKSLVQLLKRIGQGVSSLKIKVEPISLVNFMMRILDTVKIRLNDGPKSFYSLMTGLLPRNGKPAAEEKRRIVIGSFVAVLELVKRGLMTVSQPDTRGDIKLEFKIGEVGDVNADQLSEVGEEWKALGEAQTPNETATQIPVDGAPNKVVQMADYVSQDSAPVESAAGVEELEILEANRS